MKRKKKKHQRVKLKKSGTVKYVCSECGEKDDIPVEVLEHFDEVNPQQLLYGSHNFYCEKCEIGIMKPENEDLDNPISIEFFEL